MGQGKRYYWFVNLDLTSMSWGFTACVACDECGIESFGYVCCSDVYLVLLDVQMCASLVCGITRGMILSDGVFCTFSPCGV